MSVNELRANKSIGSFEVVDKDCKNSRRPSYVIINTPKGSHKMRYLRKECFELERGELIELYHNSSYDFFYIPGNPVYQRVVAGVTLLLLVTLLPWNRMLRK